MAKTSFKSGGSYGTKSSQFNGVGKNNKPKGNSHVTLGKRVG
jgi:hypothetical protein